MTVGLTVHAAEAGDEVAMSWVRRCWADTAMAVHGQLYDLGTLPALVAVADDTVTGVLTYRLAEHALEIISCDADPPGHGTGRALVNAAAQRARDLSLHRIRCTTTNDNLPALGFWQAVGFTLVALRPEGVTASRQLKSTIPALGYRGLPIRDELDLEMIVPAG